MTTLQERRTSAPTTARDRTGTDAGHTSHPAELMARHPELYGVHTLADVVSDSVLWSA